VNYLKVKKKKKKKEGECVESRTGRRTLNKAFDEKKRSVI